jgi:ElaB/YqjD/DUF883 family membrane-anchored ribosome-binding protein
VGYMSETVVDSAAAMRDGFTNIFSKGADLASTFGDTIGETSVELFESMRKSIKRNPMIAVGIAFAGGLLLGGAALFLARRGVSAAEEAVETGKQKIASKAKKNGKAASAEHLAD